LEQVADREKARVRHILQILCIAVRPIRLTEVAEVYQIGDGIQPPFANDSVLFYPEDIIDICQGLLSLVAMDGRKFSISGFHHHPTNEESITIIQLAHFSVKEYLFSSSSLSWMLTEEISHISIIRTSIAAFLNAASNDAPVDSATQLQNTDSLAGYFNLYLSHPLDMLHPREHPVLVPSLQVLFDNRLPYSDRIIKLWYSLGIGYRAREIVKPQIALFQSPRNDQILIFAALLGLTDTLQWLLSSGRVPLSAINGIRKPYPPIVAAVLSGCIDTVQCLIDLRADLDAVAWQFRGSAIQAASRGGYVDIVRLLIKAGAKVNHQSSFDSCALSLASGEGHETIVRLLLDAGADVDGKPRGGYWMTPIAIASFGGHTEIVRMLIEAGADARLDYADGSPPALSSAASKGYIEIVRLLIGAGVDVNYHGGRFNTPLQSAVYGGHTEIVRILLEANADPNAWDKASRRGPPLEIANEEGFPEIASLLIHHGARLDAP
jgi:ankyrin repeat protein